MLRLACVLSAVLLMIGCDENDELAPPVEGFADYGDSAMPAYDDDVAPDASTPVLTAADASVAPESDAGSTPVEIVTDEPSLPVEVAPSCVAVSWFRDTDRDSFGDPASEIVSCIAPAKDWIRRGGDCFDGNALAHPGQTAWGVDVDRGDGSYDFDCDGVETRQDTGVASCPTFTADDARCPPSQIKSIPSDDDNPYCFDAIRAKSDAHRDGWWETSPKCGSVSSYGLSINYSREAGYTCAMPAAALGRRVLCR